MRWMQLALLLVLVGCWGQTEEPPGDPVGSFDAAGFMVVQSCGSAIPAPDPIELRFELRSESNGRAYWRREGGSLFAGVEKDGVFSFQVGQSWTVYDPDNFRGYVGCSVTQRDVFTFEVETVEVVEVADAGVDDAAVSDAGLEDAAVDDDPGAVAEPVLLTLTGSQTTEIVPLTGSDCTPAVVARGGPFLALPCKVEYVLSGNGVAVE